MDDNLRRQIFDLMRSWVELYMSGDKFDASHDFQHVDRVLSNARHILKVESARPGAPAYDAFTVDLAALLHDVDDHKYVKESIPIRDIVKMALLNAGADEAMSEKVQTICANVSYSNEIRHPSQVQMVIQQYPELRIVQDADRLDALGAVGIARTFAYTGALSARGQERSLPETIQHFHDKLERLEGMMKTEEGKRIAGERTKRLKDFRDWFTQEGGMEE